MSQKRGWVDFEEIKATVGMEAILDHYGLLEGLKQKGNELAGFCPIHDKKHYNENAFSANTEKQVWHCFACGRGGNILDFVAQMEETSIRGAALLIKHWFQVGGGRQLAREEEGPSERKEEANPPLTFQLKLDPGHPYLEERGLEKRTIKEFGVGYCSRGIMKGRIAIPIHNEGEELVAYAGRWPGDPPEGEPKYKLPPGFKKHLVLFNLNRAKGLAGEGLILVEGFFDVFELWQEGKRNVVAMMGTALSEEQQELLLEALGPEGRLALQMDPDEAGRKAEKEITAKLIGKLFIKIEKSS